MTLKAGALFAGYGGLELGISQVLDIQTTWVAEVEAGPSKILAERFPDAPNLGDVTKIDWAAVEPVDIISGGSPCQDLSHAGKRAGMKAGTRSGLWASMCDAIETIRPQLVVWENVRGALSAPATTGNLERCDFCMGDDRDDPMRALGRVLGDLAELGYDTAWCGLRAADVGAPHGRYRIFVLAWDTAAIPTDLRHERTRTARDGWARPADRSGTAINLLPTPAVNDMGAGKTVEHWDAWTNRMKTQHANGNGHGKSLSIETQRLAVLPTPTVGDSKSTRNSTATRHKIPPTGIHAGDTLTDAVVPTRGVSRDFGQYAPAVARWETILNRTAPTPTEPTGKDDAHRLSPHFVEWMMGLPDGWVTDIDTTRHQKLKALGNGVVPQQAAAALRHLLGVRDWATAS